MNFFTKLLGTKKPSKERELLEKLLKVMSKDVINDNKIRRAGMCYYIHDVTNDSDEAQILHRLIYDNRPDQHPKYNNVYFFPTYLYEPRASYLKKLIKKY